MRCSVPTRSISRPLTALFAGLLLACSSDKTPEPVDTGVDAGPPKCPNDKTKVTSPPTCEISPNIGNPCAFESTRKVQYICNLGFCPSDGCVQTNFTDINPTFGYWCCEK
jgi:hypothetical protein